MAAEFIEIHPENPQLDKILKVVSCIQKGGLVIYPTDTVYGLGCDIFNTKAIEKICRIKNIKMSKAQLSFICYDLSHISNYAKHLDNNIFKLMKKTLPGPYTYILNASSQVPKILQASKKTIGIRVPDNNIPREIVRELGNPIITTSLSTEDDYSPYRIDPELIYDDYKNIVDIVINGGMGSHEPSTVLDCTSGEVDIIRQGIGEIEKYL